MASSAASCDPPSSTPKSALSSKKVDPVLRNALRYTVSARDYQHLHQYLISRSSTLRKRAPTVARFESIVRSEHDFNPAAVRASLRVFLASQAGLKLWDLISTRLFARGQP